MRLFAQTFRITPETRVLDVGGSPSIWDFAPVRPRLTIANMPSALVPGSSPVDLVGADGLSLPFADRSFDIAFSNSVIEHVGSLPAQRRFAQEIARVGRSYWVQTPNRTFPIEMHTMMPGVHFLPKHLALRILEKFSVWEWTTHPQPEQKRFYLHHVLNEMSLLTAPVLAELFPDARILKERMLGFPKSLIAVRRLSQRMQAMKVC